VYRTSRNARRFSEIPAEMFDEIVAAFSLPDHEEIWAPANAAIRESFLLLAARVQGLGISREFRERGNFDRVTASPFFQLTRFSDVMLTALDRRTGVESAFQKWTEAVKACRNEIRAVHFRLNTAGVSVAMVFAIEIMEKCLHRMEIIVEILMLEHGPKRSNAIHRLVSICIIASCEDQSLWSLVSSNAHLLCKKIVERTGEIGEHYIARTPREYGWMWVAAAGGGLLTVATATLKLNITALHMPLLVEGLLSGMNYALSFILMLICGFALATKQPAMTGAALAGILREHSGPDRLERIATMAMLTCRTQLAAALGNIALVSVGALCAASVWMKAFGSPLIDAASARYAIESLNPLASGTVLFAAFTGVILWFSSLVGGWIENWSVCNKLPQGIADHRLGEKVGVEWMSCGARFWNRNIGSWSTAIALGFLLGLTPVLGKFAGLPIDVRHVTLSTGTLALAAATLQDVPSQFYMLAAAGIAITFMLNLSISFLLAFFTAVWAYKLSWTEQLELAAVFVRKAVCQPWRFVLPIGWPPQTA